MSTELIAMIIFLLISVGAGIALFVVVFIKHRDDLQKEKEITLLEKQTASAEATAERVLDQNTQLTKTNTELTQKNTQLQEENIDLSTLNEEYAKFVQRVYAVLSDDIGFLQGELAQKLSLDIPEVRSLHIGLQRLREDISAIKDIVEESERVKNE